MQQDLFKIEYDNYDIGSLTQTMLVLWLQSSHNKFKYSLFF